MWTFILLAFPCVFSRSLVHLGDMFGIAAAKANFSEVITEEIGSWRPWLVFLLGIFGILCHMQVFVLAWGTTFYVVPLYLFLHLCLATWVSNVGIAPLVVFPTGQQPSAGGPAAEGAMLPVAQPGAATGGGSSTCDTGGGAHGRGHRVSLRSG